MDSTMDVLQAGITAYDTGMSNHWRVEDRRWRDEDRKWRAEDMDYREIERKRLEEEAEMRELEKTWRSEDLEQRHVENARYLWLRFVEKNRRDVEEKSEQLKAISNLAALFAGFAVVTLTQFNFDYSQSPEWIIASFGILTSISICLHTLAMVLCTLILGSILKNGKTYVDEEAEEEFMFACRDFVDSYHPGNRPPAPRRTFEAFWELRCEGDWRLAFNLFTWGVFSFLVELIPIGWIKFHFSASIASAFMAICILCIFVWGWIQCSWGYYLTSKRKDVTSVPPKSSFHDVQVGLPFDWHKAPEKISNNQTSFPTQSQVRGGNVSPRLATYSSEVSGEDQSFSREMSSLERETDERNPQSSGELRRRVVLRNNESLSYPLQETNDLAEDFLFDNQQKSLEEEIQIDDSP